MEVLEKKLKIFIVVEPTSQLSVYDPFVVGIYKDSSRLSLLKRLTYLNRLDGLVSSVYIYLSEEKNIARV